MKRGLTLIEVLVAAILGCLLFGVVSMVINRTNVTFTKTTDLIKAQVLLESIIQHLRSDVRSMTGNVETLPDGIRFRIRRRGRPGTITYRFDADAKAVVREVTGMAGADRRQDFQSCGNIDLATFQAGEMDRPGVEDLFDHIDLVLHIQVQERPNMPPSRISLIGQVFSKCVQFPNPFRGGNQP
jgi:prepilin-type N-terminal cleavage/methylation domain-containing protein